MNIKKAILVLVFALTLFAVSSSVAEARVSVRGYYKRSGAYVMPYYRTSPNRVRYDNWSSKGNYNPYTGKSGYINWWR